MITIMKSNSFSSKNSTKENKETTQVNSKESNPNKTTLWVKQASKKTSAYHNYYDSMNNELTDWMFSIGSD